MSSMEQSEVDTAMGTGGTISHRIGTGSTGKVQGMFGSGVGGGGA